MSECSGRPRALPVRLTALLLALLAGVASHAFARTPAPPVPPHAVIGVEDRHLQPDYWIGRQPAPDRVILDDDSCWTPLYDDLSRGE